MNGVSGLNTRTILTNRDNELAAMLSASGRYALCMNDPALSAMAAGQGIQVIHRESGDAPEDEPLRQDPVAFVQKRVEHAPGAAYIHLLNEIDPSSDEQRWTREALKYVHSIKRHAVVGNYATHRSREQWEFARPLLAEAAGAGDAIGFHLYVPDAAAAGGLEWRPTQLAIGGRWLCTEFAFGRYAPDGQIDPHRGWRGITSPATRRAFIEKWTAFFAAMGIGLLWYSYDFWDKPTLEVAKAEGFGYNDLPDVINAFRDFSTTYPLKEAIPMPVVTPAPDGLGAPFTTRTAVALKLRPTPATAQPEIRVIPQGVAVTVYQQPRITGGDYVWTYTQDGVGNSGYTAVEYAPGKPSYDPPMPAVVEPPPVEPPPVTHPTPSEVAAALEALNGAKADNTAVGVQIDNAIALIKGELLPAAPNTVTLDIPFVSQRGSDADISNNDCGAASLLMLTRYAMKTRGFLVPDVPTVDDLVPYTPLGANPAGLLNFTDLTALAKRLGFTAVYKSGLTPDALRRQLDTNTPVMVLLDYSVYYLAGAKIPHLLVVSGYDGDEFITQDPYLRGANVRVGAATLEAAMTTVPMNTGSGQGMVLAA